MKEETKKGNEGRIGGIRKLKEGIIRGKTEDLGHGLLVISLAGDA